MRDTFCSSCGARYPLAPGVYPRRCDACGEVTFRNPVPVAVALVPVPGGLLTVQRGIPPHIGEFALPGGFVDFGEAWQQGCAREVFEETGVRVDADAITLFDVQSTPDGFRVLIFGLCPRLDHLPALVPNHETLSLGVYSGYAPAAAGGAPIDLAFPLHTAAALKWLGCSRSPRSGPS